MIPLCQAENIAIIPWTPLARVLLAGTRKNPADTKATVRAETDDFVRKLYDQPSDQDVIDAVRAVAQKRGVPAARVALAWMLSKPYITAPIIGASKMSHFDDAVAALDLEMSADEIKQLEAPYKPHPVRGH